MVWRLLPIVPNSTVPGNIGLSSALAHPLYRISPGRGFEPRLFGTHLSLVSAQRAAQPSNARLSGDPLDLQLLSRQVPVLNVLISLVPCKPWILLHLRSLSPYTTPPVSGRRHSFLHFVSGWPGRTSTGSSFPPRLRFAFV